MRSGWRFPAGCCGTPTELSRIRERIFGRDAHDTALDPDADRLLAPGAGDTDPLPVYLVDPAAVSHCRDRSGRGAGTGEGDLPFAGEGPGRGTAVLNIARRTSALMNF